MKHNKLINSDTKKYRSFIAMFFPAGYGCRSVSFRSTGSLHLRKSKLKMKSVITMLAILLVILFELFISLRNPALAQTHAKTSIEVLTTRPVWKDLPPEFLDALSAKLGSVAVTTDFVSLCETTGILQNNILKIAHEEPAFAVGLVAQTLTSFANAMGELGEFNEAKRALKLALLVRPRALNAMNSMALVAIGQNDCKTAMAFADKVLTSKPDPHSDDSLEVGEAGMWNEIKGLAEVIKDMCRGKN